MLWMANSSLAMRQCRFRHWDDNASANRAAEGHPLGQTAIVAVQQRGRVGVQCVDLKESWRGHGRSLFLFGPQLG